MSEADLKTSLRKIVLAHRRDPVGLARVSDPPEHVENISRILPGSQSVFADGGSLNPHYGQMF